MKKVLSILVLIFLFITIILMPAKASDLNAKVFTLDPEGDEVVAIHIDSPVPKGTFEFVGGVEGQIIVVCHRYFQGTGATIAHFIPIHDWTTINFSDYEGFWFADIIMGASWKNRDTDGGGGVTYTDEHGTKGFWPAPPLKEFKIVWPLLYHEYSYSNNADLPEYSTSGNIYFNLREIKKAHMPMSDDPKRKPFDQERIFEFGPKTGKWIDGTATMEEPKDIYSVGFTFPFCPGSAKAWLEKQVQSQHSPDTCILSMPGAVKDTKAGLESADRPGNSKNSRNIRNSKLLLVLVLAGVAAIPLMLFLLLRRRKKKGAGADDAEKES